MEASPPGFFAPPLFTTFLYPSETLMPSTYVQPGSLSHALRISLGIFVAESRHGYAKLRLLISVVVYDFISTPQTVWQHFIKPDRMIPSGWNDVRRLKYTVQWSPKMEVALQALVVRMHWLLEPFVV